MFVRKIIDIVRSFKESMSLLNNYLTLFVFIIIVCHMYIYNFIVYENKE